MNEKSSSSAGLSIVMVPIQKLKPNLYNPRKWTEKQTEHLRESIERFGFVDPIIVNGAKKRKNIVIGGHFRLKVARDLGIKEILEASGIQISTFGRCPKRIRNLWDAAFSVGATAEYMILQIRISQGGHLQRSPLPNLKFRNQILIASQN